MSNQTLFDKIWEAHLVQEGITPPLLYVDIHLLHEVTSPQAFTGLRSASLPVRRPDLCLATVDHIVPTINRHVDQVIQDPEGRLQVETLQKNCADFGIRIFPLASRYQGIVHVIGPELGLSLPGTVIVCGDSHTSTQGAFGAFALGIGTTEVEHVLATQTLRMTKPKNFEVNLTGDLPFGVSAKDVALGIIRQIGVSAGAGFVIEYTGPVVRAFTMEERMTLCNMSIESGARAGLIAPDQTTFDYLEDRKYAPKGETRDLALLNWKSLSTDAGAQFDKRVEIDVSSFTPFVTWGTNPAQSSPIDGEVPPPDSFPNSASRESAQRALDYMGLTPGTKMTDIDIDRVFIGSCTNARLSDLRAAAAVVDGRQVAPTVSALVVPGSTWVKAQAEAEGLDQIFLDAGFEWRDSGCSMCLGMNPDILAPFERCASTSNRNFEGRQGRDGRTHLVSPVMAAAAALAGHIVDARAYQPRLP